MCAPEIRFAAKAGFVGALGGLEATQELERRREIEMCVRELWLEPKRALETFGGSLVLSHMAEDDADGVECPGQAWPEGQRPLCGCHGFVRAMQRRQPACELRLRFGV